MNYPKSYIDETIELRKEKRGYLLPHEEHTLEARHLPSSNRRALINRGDFLHKKTQKGNWAYYEYLDVFGGTDDFAPYDWGNEPNYSHHD